MFSALVLSVFVTISSSISTPPPAPNTSAEPDARVEAGGVLRCEGWSGLGRGSREMETRRERGSRDRNGLPRLDGRGGRVQSG